MERRNQYAIANWVGLGYTSYMHWCVQKGPLYYRHCHRLWSERRMRYRPHFSSLVSLGCYVSFWLRGGEIRIEIPAAVFLQLLLPIHIPRICHPSTRTNDWEKEQPLFIAEYIDPWVKQIHVVNPPFFYYMRYISIFIYWQRILLTWCCCCSLRW